MRLESIELTNFRQYFGSEQAEFSMGTDQNVTIFHGLNGAGKTSLFTAINWCLYGAAVDGIGELVNRKALNEVPDGDDIFADVKVTFRHEDRRFLATRRLSAIRIGNASARHETMFTLVRFHANGNSETVPNPLAVMNSILAANVRPYFFFDGERMEDLTKADNEEVREAVRNVMRLPMLERAEEHLGYVAAEYRKEIKKQGSGVIESLISLEEDLRSQKLTRIRRRDELVSEVASFRQRVQELEQKLRDSAGAKALQLRRDEIDRELSRWERLERETTRGVQATLNRSYHRFLAPTAEAALAILDQKRERGEIPSGVREQVIKDLLDAHICICGREFTDGDAAYDHLHARLKSTTSKQIEGAANSLSAGIRALSSIFANQATTLELQCRRRQEAKQEIERLYVAKGEVDHELSTASGENISGLEQLRASFQTKLERCIGEQATNEQAIARLDQQLADTIRRKTEAEAKEQKLALLSRSELLAQKAADAVSGLRLEFFEETRKNIERATKEVFGKLAWKDEQFQDVQIDSSFRLEVIDRWNTPTRKELSAGERQILSLSFICAMSGLSGEEAPLVMDTPFGRLSGNHLETVAKNLPSLSKQLILFVTDREWDESSKTSLAPKTGRQYRLEFDQTDGCTRIVEVSK